MFCSLRQDFVTSWHKKENGEVTLFLLYIFIRAELGIGLAKKKWTKKKGSTTTTTSTTNFVVCTWSNYSLSCRSFCLYLPLSTPQNFFLWSKKIIHFFFFDFFFFRFFFFRIFFFSEFFFDFFRFFFLCPKPT